MRNTQPMRMYGYKAEDYPDLVTQCGHCGWCTTRIYVVADTHEQAVQLLESEEAGLCGDCMCDMLSECNYNITHEEEGNHEN